jgi:hypothetical protein
MRAGFHRFLDQSAHLLHFVFIGLTLGGVFAHGVKAQRRMADKDGGIDRSPSGFDGVEIFREGDEWPVAAETRFQRLSRHALDFFQRLDNQFAMLRPRRRDTKAAIAQHGGGDAMPGRDGHHAIPHHLRVVMRMHVDEARAHRLAGGVDGLARFAWRFAQGNDPTVLDANIAFVGCLAAAIDDGAAGDLDVVLHGFLPERRARL